ncbi:MAG: aminomethyl-transferring glycine dehydrogenase subunit GcvPB, partial [Erysipelotrichaceae bacterium]|nr:aminomethyl-transferring glycine dehydrogenase subunit GcvPB [Erysipelotrichaceae bacterium]
MKLLFERSVKGRGSDILPEITTGSYRPETKYLRQSKMHLPEISEVDLGRHYTQLMKQTHGVNDGFYPLGSCTMKYNPRVDEETASLPDFTQI